MGHNRGWEEAASVFAGASVELKTCNAALLETTGKTWSEVGLFRNFPSGIYLYVLMLVKFVTRQLKL